MAKFYGYTDTATFLQQVQKGAEGLNLGDPEVSAIFARVKPKLAKLNEAAKTKSEGFLTLICLTRRTTNPGGFAVAVLKVKKKASAGKTYTLDKKDITTAERIWPKDNWFGIALPKTEDGAEKVILSEVKGSETQLADEMIRLCNTKRPIGTKRKDFPDKKVTKLKKDSVLMRSAQKHASKMAKKGGDCYHMVTLPKGVNAENVHAGPITAKSAMTGGIRKLKIKTQVSGTVKITELSINSKGFMDSKGHRENILKQRFHSIGVGVAVGIKEIKIGNVGTRKVEEVYWCQHFSEKE